MNARQAAVVVGLAVALLGTLASSQARAEERHFALIVGYNGQPAESDEPTTPLRYADDDALAFFELERETGAEAILLTIPDVETRRRHPASVELASPPTKAELARAVVTLNARMEAVARAGDTPVFVFFYSGHGTRRQGSEAALTLLDGGLTQSALYEQLLDKIRAPLVHMIIDACHAAAVVRARDVDAATVELAPPDLAAGLSKTTAARYPNVGFVIATSGSTATQEWDYYESGVFTHEVISGLRGLADVNGDRQVEYSELDAFLMAANRQVVDPRARVRSIVQAPAIRSHAALIRLGPRGRSGWLTGVPSSLGQFFLEDARGNRLVDGYAEVGFSMSLAVPPGEPLFLRSQESEAEILIGSRDQKRFDTLSFRVRPARARGAIEHSLRKGLFAMPYGPAYYSGYVDRSDEVALVVPAPSLVSTTPLQAPPATRRNVPAWSLLGASATLLVSSAVFGALSLDAWRDHENTQIERKATEASDRFKTNTTLAVAFLVPGIACAVAGYFLRGGR